MEYSSIIPKLINNYYNDLDYQSEVNKKYDDDFKSLSFAEIYLVEVIAGYGTRGIFKSLACFYDDETAALDNLGPMIDSLRTESLRRIIIKKNYQRPELLTDEAKAVLEIFYNSELKYAPYDYDQYFPLDFDDETAAKTTIVNLLFSKLLAKPENIKEIDKTIPEREITPGRYASVDKDSIISWLALNIPDDETINKIVYDTYRAYKDYLNAQGVNILEATFQYRTNITAEEVFKRLHEFKNPTPETFDL